MDNAYPAVMLANNKQVHSTPVSHHYTSISRTSSFNQSLNPAIHPVNHAISHDSLLTPTLSPYAQPPSSPFFAASLFPPLNSPFLSPLTSFHQSSNQAINQFHLTPLIESSGDPFSTSTNSNGSSFNQPFAFNALPVVPALNLSGHPASINQSMSQTMGQSTSLLHRSSTHDYLTRSYTPSPPRLRSPLLSLAASTSSGSEEEDEVNISMKPLRFFGDNSPHDDSSLSSNASSFPSSDQTTPVHQHNEKDRPSKSRLKRKHHSLSREKLKQKKRKSKSRSSDASCVCSPPASPSCSASESGSCCGSRSDADGDADCVSSVTGSSPTINIKLGVGSSCHQCKTRKLLPELFVCGNFDKKKVKVMKKKLCRKKYCARCLIKFYSQPPPDTPMGATGCTSLGQDCPSCLGLCVCAACRKRYARDCSGGKDTGESSKEEDEQSVSHPQHPHSSGESDDEQRIAHKLKQQHQQQTILSLTAALTLPGTEISPLVDLIHMA